MTEKNEQLLSRVRTDTTSTPGQKQETKGLKSEIKPPLKIANQTVLWRERENISLAQK